MKIYEILNGWANVVKDEFGILDDDTKKLSQSRLVECNGCSMRDKNTCSTDRWDFNVRTGVLTNGCGCNIAAKTMSPSSSCPLSKW